MQDKTPQAQYIASQIHWAATTKLVHETLAEIKSYLAQCDAQHSAEALELLAGQLWYEALAQDLVSRTEHKIMQALAEHIIFSARANS